MRNNLIKLIKSPFGGLILFAVEFGCGLFVGFNLRLLVTVVNLLGNLIFVR